MLENEDYYRAAVSRYCYATYQAVTALVLYRGLTTPMAGGVMREVWSHADTPAVFVQQLEPYVRSREKRSDVAGCLRELYDKRIVADYFAVGAVDSSTVVVVRRNVGYVVCIAEDILA